MEQLSGNRCLKVFLLYAISLNQHQVFFFTSLLLWKAGQKKSPGFNPGLGPLFSYAGSRWSDYLPWYWGFLFSKKALTPSLWSAELPAISWQ